MPARREEIDKWIDRGMQVLREDIGTRIERAMQAHREELHTRIDQAVQAEREKLRREAILWAQKFVQENKKLREDAEESCRSNEHLEQRLTSRLEKSEKEVQSLSLQLQKQDNTISTDLKPRLRRMKHRLQVHMEKHVGWRHRWESQLDVRLARLGEINLQQP